MDGSRLQITPCIAHYFEMRDKLHKTKKASSLLSTKEAVLRLKVNASSKNMIENWNDILRLISEVYISLSNAKYFNDNFSSQVLEDIPNNAELHVVKKSIGSSLYNFNLIENDPTHDPNALLGLSLGGSQIHDAKINFKNLLTLLVNQAELRYNFIVLANDLKSTSRKVNVINKMLVPKIENTVKYILDEIEDMDREDHFRIKKVKAAKNKEIENLHPRAFSHSSRFSIQLLEDMIYPVRDLLQKLPRSNTNVHNKRIEVENPKIEDKQFVAKNYCNCKKDNNDDYDNGASYNEYNIVLYFICTVAIGYILYYYML